MRGAVCLWMASVAGVPCSAAALPPPFDLGCTAERSSVTLAWTNPDAVVYDAIVIERDGTMLVTLGGGADTSYIDYALCRGAYLYHVSGVVGGEVSPRAECSVAVTYVEPLGEAACVPDAYVVHLSWSETAEAYTGVRVLRDGGEIALLGAGVGAFDDAIGAAGSHAYALVGLVDAYAASPSPCDVTIAPIPGPTELECACASDVVTLSWSNGTAYDAVRVLRDGEEAALLPGDAVAWLESFVTPDVRIYAVDGIVDSFATGSAAQCEVTNAHIPPPESLRCVAMGRRVSMSWVNPIAYSAIDMYRNGEVIARLPHDATAFTEIVAEAAVYAYDVVAYLETFNASVTCEVEVVGGAFIRGDMNASGRIDIADVIFLLSYLFRHGPRPPCDDAADVNDDRALDVSDVIYLLSYAFSHTRPPEAPFPNCGAVPAPLSMGCASFPPCER